jgi:hypothetical protein
MEERSEELSGEGKQMRSDDVKSRNGVQVKLF